MKQTPSRMDVFFLTSNLRLYPGLKMSFEHISIRKKFFLSACFYWDSRLSLREMDQNFKIGGTIGYGNSYFEFLFRHFKMFALHAIIHDAAGAVPSHTGRSPGYCYMIGRGPNSCLLRHVTGLLFCLYVKIILPSIFISVDFWISLSLIVLDVELTEKNVIKELGLFIDGCLKCFSSGPPKNFETSKRTTWDTSHLHGIAWSKAKLDYDELFAVFYDVKVMNAEVFAKGL